MNLEELIYRQKYTRNEFAAMLLNLLPRGPIWRIPLPEELEVIVNSIPSGEAFGNLSITTGNVSVYPYGITSFELFGYPTVSL